MLSIEKSLAFHPLTILADPPDIMVGRADIESYAAFPEDGVALLKQLQAGMSLQEAGAWYLTEYGESLDIADFVEVLRDLQFLREEGEEASVVAEPSDFWNLVGRLAFSPPAWVLYTALVGFCLYLLVRFPYLRPVNSDIIFSPYVSLIELGLFFGQFPGMLFHEGFHMLAGRRLGIPSRLSVGRRFYFLVFQTHLNGLWNVPREKRYLPFLAGILGDLLWFSLLTILASVTYTPGIPFSFGTFLLAMALLTTLRLAWQFYFYLQTDLYFVLTNALRCVNLQQTTRQFLFNRFYRLVGWRKRIIDEEQWNPRDRAIVPLYVPFFLGGYIFSTATILFVGLPVALKLVGIVWMELFSPLVFTTLFWNTILFLALNGLQIGLVVVLVALEFRKARARKRGGRAFTALDSLELNSLEVTEA